jgi:uncharacterized protein YodC (DUF2158 family)
MAKFAVGDVVRLKSGGPKMTVNLVEDDVVSCVWFVDTEELLHGDFDPLALCLAFEEDFGFYDDTPLSEEELDCIVEQSNYYQDHGR